MSKIAYPMPSDWALIITISGIVDSVNETTKFS